MVSKTSLVRGMLTAVLLWSGAVAGVAAQDEMADIKQELVAIPLERDPRVVALDALLARTHALNAANPGRADLMLWEGIVAASLAGTLQNVRSLGLITSARDLFEAAEQLDPAALDWSVYSLMGYLYANVPGWPLSFRDRDRSREYYQKALALNPDGAEPHRSYGELLMQEDEYEEAAREFELSLRGAMRAGDAPGDDWACNATYCRPVTAELDMEYREATRRMLEEARREAE